MKKLLIICLLVIFIAGIPFHRVVNASSFDFLVQINRSKITCVPGATIQFQFSLKNQTKQNAEIKMRSQLINHSYAFDYSLLSQDSPAPTEFTLLTGQERKFTAVITTTVAVPIGSRGVLQCQFYMKESKVAEALLYFFVVDKITMILRIGNKTVQIADQDPVQLDVAPYIRISRTFVPLRFIGESFGATIGWFDKEKKVTYTLRDIHITFWINQDQYLVNGTYKTMDVAPEIQPPGRTFVPLRVVSEEFGATVEWNASQQTIKIIFSPK
jgi:hypothetical protein